MKKEEVYLLAQKYFKNRHKVVDVKGKVSYFFIDEDDYNPQILPLLANLVKDLDKNIGCEKQTLETT